CQQETDWPRTF
nr:immunoglobulin light chain junction region [Macaca mulatta]